MNKQELFDYYQIKPKSIHKKGSVSIISTKSKKYVMKKNKRKADSFAYLETRNFHNFPKVYSCCNDEIELTDYIEEKETPKEQRLEDLVYLTSILHNKTTFYKTVDIDYIKHLYEDLLERQSQLYQYYQEDQNMIDLEIYMSPANYLLVRNISMVYDALKQSRDYLEKWYELVKENHQFRFCFIHGNLEASHFIESDDLYFISWDQARVDLPIYDLEKFYRKSFLDISLKDMLEIYEAKYPLKKEELYLLLALLLLPDKIDITASEYLKTKQVTSIVFYLQRILSFLENDSKKTNYYTNHQ